MLEKHSAATANNVHVAFGVWKNASPSQISIYQIPICNKGPSATLDPMQEIRRESHIVLHLLMCDFSHTKGKDYFGRITSGIWLNRAIPSPY